MDPIMNAINRVSQPESLMTCVSRSLIPQLTIKEDHLCSLMHRSHADGDNKPQEKACEEPDETKYLNFRDPLHDEEVEDSRKCD